MWNNNITLIGRLTKKPELTVANSGVTLTSFHVAVQRYKKDEVDFVPVTLFGKVAEFACSYAEKGDLVLIDGTLRVDKVNDNGRRNTYIKVIGNVFQLLRRKEGARSETIDNEAETYQAEEVQESFPTDEVPF